MIYLRKMLLLAFVMLFSAKADAVQYTFRVTSADAGKISVAGDFNSWAMDSIWLNKDDGGEWSVTLDVAPGPHEFKFIKDGDWDALNKDNRKIDVPADGALSVTEAPKGASGTVFEVLAPGASKVSIAGAFNNWNPDEKLLEKNADGKWSITIELAPGTYEYKFLKDGDWDALNKDNRKIEVSAGKTVQAPANIPEVPSEKVSVPFSFKNPNAKRVTLAGNFNGWNMDATALDGPDADGNWTTTLLLQPGEYEYKFLSDDNWEDGANKKISVPAAGTSEKSSPAKGTSGTVFEVLAPGASKVSIAGAFNNWNPDEKLLEKNADGKWSITIELAPGTYEYKFLKDGDWDALNKDNRKIIVP